MNIRNNVTGLQHIGIPTKDIEITISFYESLGFELVHRTINPANGDQVAFLRMHNLTVETYECAAAEMRSGAIDHVALDVSDVEAVFDILSTAGYVLLDKEVQFLPFWEHGVKFFTICGPNKEKIEFSQVL